MADKISKKLTMGERFILLNHLPQGDLVTLKILRKLKETLAPNEIELKEYGFRYSFRCPHKKFDEEGKASQCEVEEQSETTPKCPIHDVLMLPSGRVAFSPEKWKTEKEVWFGNKANSIIVETIKKMIEENKEKKGKDENSDIITSLYEKFIEDADDKED